MERMKRIGALLALLLLGCGSSQSDSAVDDDTATTDTTAAGSGGSAQAHADAAAAAGGTKASLGGSTGSGGATAATGGSTGSGGATAATGGSTGSGGTGVVRDAGRGNCPTRPALTPGVWKNITPSALSLPGTYGVTFVTVAPSNSCTLYASFDVAGLWRTTDGAATWAKVGTPPATYGPTTTYLDSPVAVAVDPDDTNHLYATEGVRGTSMGFWVSTDAGATWTMPPGFVSISSTIGTVDMTAMVVDPTDFKHVLVGSHSAWKGMGNAGILESKDGGATFVAHAAPASWPAGSLGIHFLYAPDLAIGNNTTWLVGLDGNGFWRTTDAGTSWTQVETWGTAHGGHAIYYAKNGTLYAGGYQYPVRSTDNGLTWKQISTGLPYAYYYTVQGDGKSLYTMRSYADNGARYNEPYQTSPETDGATWTPYQAGAQKFDNGPATMVFDPTDRILYSANWTAGLWALEALP
jgi:hypothetical protein